MKKIALIGLGLIVALLSFKVPAQSDGESIVGVWYAEDFHDAVIEVVRLKDGTYEGVIQASSKEDYVGHKVIYDFEYDEEEMNYIGTIKAVARNIELDGTIILEEDGRLKLTGKKFVMTRTFYWERKNDSE